MEGNQELRHNVYLNNNTKNKNKLKSIEFLLKIKCINNKKKKINKNNYQKSLSCKKK